MASLNVAQYMLCIAYAHAVNLYDDMMNRL